jgi:hypothetical protein
LRDKIVVYGAVPRANIRPTDLGPVILPEDDGFACREMRWGCAFSTRKRDEVGVKPIHEVQTKQCVNGRAENFGGMFTFGKVFDLFGVEEKQVSDAAGNVALNVFIPMFAEERVELGIAGDFDVFLDTLGSLPPRTGNAVVVHIAVHCATKTKFNGCAIGGVSTAMNHIAEIITIAKFAATRATSLCPVKCKLDGVEEGGLATAIHAAEKDDGFAVIRRCEDGFLPTAEDAEIFESDGVKNHGRRLDSVSHVSESSEFSANAAVRWPWPAAEWACAWRRAMSVASSLSS